MNNSKKPSISSQIALTIAKKCLQKYRNYYTKLYNNDLDIFLVGGTAGKSTLTLMLSSLFKNSGYTVYTGASTQSCLNSVTGIAMTLAGFQYNFEGRGGWLKKILFTIRGFLFIFFGRIDIPKKTIVIYEVGVDTQYEMQDFLSIFENGVKAVFLTNATYEHTGGFSNTFDQVAYENVKSHIPLHWQHILEDSSYTGVLKNIALEQFKLLSLTQTFIVPLSLGGIDNGVLSNLLGNSTNAVDVTASRDRYFDLHYKNFSFGEKYLLPLTFGKNIYILSEIAKLYNISEDIIQDTLENIELPNGRYGKFKGVKNTTIIDSTYNSDPASLLSFLSLFEEVSDIILTRQQGGELVSQYAIAPKHIFILGEMRELGKSSKIEHRVILDRLVDIKQTDSSALEEIFLLGKEWLCLDDGVIKQEDGIRYLHYKGHTIKVFVRAGDIIKYLSLDTIRPGTWFWVKGSQNTIFAEIIVEYLLADKSDKRYLCRQEESWQKLKTPYI